MPHLCMPYLVNENLSNLSIQKRVGWNKLVSTSTKKRLLLNIVLDRLGSHY